MNWSNGDMEISFRQIQGSHVFRRLKHFCNEPQGLHVKVTDFDELVHIFEVQDRLPIPIFLGYGEKYGVDTGTYLFLWNGFYCVDAEEMTNGVLCDQSFL